MSLAQAELILARPRMLARRLATYFEAESAKGCTPDLWPQPVALEPPYWMVLSPAPEDDARRAVFEDPTPLEELTRLRLWISPKQKCDWNRTELFLKQLSGLRHRVGYEISGNVAGIHIDLFALKQDVPVIRTAFRGLFEESEISDDPTPKMLMLSGMMEVQFRDFFPPPPYSHLLTSYEELKSTAFATLIQALSQIPTTSVGFYQCLFQPVAAGNNYHHNVETLLDLEFQIKLHNILGQNRPYLQQAPSGDLKQMAREVETKAHNDRPFFFAAVRVGVAGESGSASKANFQSTSAFMNLFQHGGRPLQSISDQDYETVVPRSSFGRMFQRGVTLRPGFLVNSRELAALAHVFSANTLKTRRIEMDKLNTLLPRDPELLHGTCIGTCDYAGTKERICIPSRIRGRSTHIVAGSDMGKTSIMLNMLLQDINEGRGAALIDIHGDAARDALRIIPPHLYHKCIYFHPADPEWVPLWNPMAISHGDEVHRRADDILGSMRQVFTDWGDRLEHVLRNALIGLLHLPECSMLDLYDLVRQSSEESKRLQTEIVGAVIEPSVKAFWQTDFNGDYRANELQAPKHKLSKLISAGPISRMLIQPENRVNLRRIMDESQILIVNLSGGGDEAPAILGSFMLAMLRSTALGREDIPPDQRRPFSIYVDEAPRFAAVEALGGMVAETRKFGLSLCIAHQYLTQFKNQQTDALGTVGTTIVGRINRRDGQFFTRDMQDLVEPIDLQSLKPFEMIARIGTEVVRINTLPPPKSAEGGNWERLVEMSREKYCMREAEIKEKHGDQYDRWQRIGGPVTGGIVDWPHTEKDLEYEEF